jgi:hypothetical protein
MSCQAQAGLLILRMCGQPAVSACSSCGIPLCGLHGAAGACPNCLATGGNPGENELAREAATRNQYYEEYGGRAEFGGARYFNAGDRESLHARGAGFAAPAGAGHDYDPLDT